jgi:hypothetical protein
MRGAVSRIEILALFAPLVLLPAMAGAGDSDRYAFRGEPGWLVLGDAGSTARAAATRRADRDAAMATVIRTDVFANLRRGLFASVYGVFPDEESANARVAELRAQGIATYVRRSGPLVPTTPGVRVRLVHVSGQLDGRLRFPVDLEIDDEGKGGDGVKVWTNENGRYEVWLRVSEGETRELTLTAGGLRERKHDPNCLGFLDKAGRVTVEPQMREVQVDWSPAPDCCDR